MRQLSFQRGGNEGTAARMPSAGPAREEAVRVVEYCPFPRSVPGQGWRIGFIRASESPGLCLEIGSALRVGTLLRLARRSIDGTSTCDLLARVSWCRSAGGGAIHTGLELLGQRGLARVQRTAPVPLARTA